MQPCFAFSNIAAANNQPAVLSIDNEVGFWGTQAKDFRASLNSVAGKELVVEINSPGGDVFAGTGIYNMLRTWASEGKTVTTKVSGVAASIASVIFLAGDKRVMPKNTWAMVHNPWTFAMGNAGELREAADTLDKISGSMVGTYADRTGLSEEEVKAMLATDTWLTADEALEKGLATEVSDEIKAVAKFDMEHSGLPENVKAMFLAAAKPKAEVVEPTEPVEEEPAAVVEETPVAEQIAALAKAAGVESHAAMLAVSCTTIEQAKARIGEAREIKALCVVANKVDAANGFIAGGKTVSEVRAELVKLMAESDEATHTDNTVKNQGSKTGNHATPQVSTDSIWASHHAKK